MHLDIPKSCDSTSKSTRVRQISRKLQDYAVTSPIGGRFQCTSATTDPKSTFKRNIFLPSVDHVVSEYTRRFSNNSTIYESIQAFDPKNASFLNFDLIDKFVSNFEGKVSGDMRENLKIEVETAKGLLSTGVTKIFDVYTFLSRTKHSFQCLLLLLEIVLTIPVTTASNERLFSTLKHVKTCIRTRTETERLSSLILMASEKEFVKNIDLEGLVDKFARMRQRRYPLL